MNWLKRIFKKKEKIEETVQIEEQKKIVLDPNREIRGYCGNCGKIIEIGEPWTKQLGKHFHRSCWKYMVKQAF